MSESLNSLKQLIKQIDNFNTDVQKSILSDLYNTHNLSWPEIAELADSYPNKIRRLANKLGIKSRTRNEAQSVAIKTNRHKHPTKGVGHKESAKVKISDNISAYFDKMTDKEREKLSKRAKALWDKKSDLEKKQLLEAANNATRLAAKEGSKLEKYLLIQLIKNGYKVLFHKEHFVIREKLQIDLFISDLNVAIEVDGPSHFDNIWGEKALIQSQNRDRYKTGLLLDRGCVVIRILQDKELSAKNHRDILSKLLDTLDSIKNKFPEKGQRHITIGV